MGYLSFLLLFYVWVLLDHWRQGTIDILFVLFACEYGIGKEASYTLVLQFFLFWPVTPCLCT